MKKTKLFWILPVVGIIFLASACASPAEVEDPELDREEEQQELQLDREDEKQELQSGVLDFETISKDTQSNYQEDGKYVIKDENAFENLWQDASDEDMPEVDFASEMVIAVFMGEKSSGGYDVEIVEILETEDTLEVTISETEPGDDDMVTMALTYPEHIISLENIDKEVNFIVQ